MSKSSKKLVWSVFFIPVFVLLSLFMVGGCQSEEPAATDEGNGEVLFEGSELNFLGWQGYDGGESITTFLDTNNIILNSVWVTNNDEIFAKLKAGGGGRYDIVTPYHGIVPSFIEHDLLEPLDLNRLPNYANLFSSFSDFDWNQKDGNIYAVPFTWGSTTLLYNADELDAPDSWDILLDPAYKDRIVVLDDPIATIIIAAHWLGYGEHATYLTVEQLNECYELLLKAKSNWRYIAPSYGDVKNALVSGEAWICMNGWDPVAVWAQEEGANIKSIVPKEGTFAFIDTLGIAKGAQNIDAAYAFLNEMIAPEFQAAWGAEMPTAVVNSESLKFMDAQQAQIFPYDEIETYFKVAIPHPPTPTESDEYATYDEWIEVWERVKAY